MYSWPVVKQKPNQFQLAIATDENKPPIVTTTNDAVILVAVEQYLSSTRIGTTDWVTVAVLFLGIVLIIVFAIMQLFERPLKKALYRIFYPHGG
jgi:hypothetical protein